jgi:hypothetical protein
MKRLDLLTVSRGRLKPEPESTRSWLQGAPGQQVQQLQHAWRGDPTWNELWQVPSLVPQPTGWENSPLRARAKILEHLERLDLPLEEWVAIDDFVAAIKRVDPDFQRPGGNYDSWYIHDTAGQPLMGFDHWEQVEGALIGYLIRHMLFWLGLVDLGSRTESSLPSLFRLTRLGQKFLKRQPWQAPQASQPVYLRADNDFYVYVPARASLYDRFQLARFASLERREGGRVTYQISRASLSRALRNGVTPEQITAFLSRATNSRIPLKVLETLQSWSDRYASAQLESATLLRFQDEQLAREVSQHPRLGPLLGEQLNATTFLVPSEQQARLRQLLSELGYLES